MVGRRGEMANSNAVTHESGEFHSKEVGDRAKTPHPIIPLTRSACTNGVAGGSGREELRVIWKRDHGCRRGEAHITQYVVPGG